MTVLAWWFAPEDKRLGYGDGREVVEGETLTVVGRPRPYRWGLHGGERMIDALPCASSSILCRVELGGHYCLRGPGGVLCAASRRTVWMRDIAPVLHEFSWRVAEDACRAAGVTDERCYAAIAAKRSWLRGETTDEQLSEARDSARDAVLDAVGDAVRDAASAAAWDAASDASWDAASDASWDAASAASRAAARAAAWDADWDAASDAAWAAVRAAQDELLTSMVEGMLGGLP